MNQTATLIVCSECGEGHYSPIDTHTALCDSCGHEVADSDITLEADELLIVSEGRWAYVLNEVAWGYVKARKSYGDSYANYLIEHDRELAAKGYSITAWPLSLVGNDGE